MEQECPVVELRQYTTHPGTRDTLVRVFEQHLIEDQERCGMRVLGQFRDLGDPDRFVWLRGFADMAARTRALEAFYSGPVWLKHRDEANATMIDHTNVLLLKPAGPGLGFRFDSRLRPPPDAVETTAAGTEAPTGTEAPGGSKAPGRDAPPGGVVIATILHLAAPPTPDILAAVAKASDAASAGGPATPLARLVTEPARNGYPRLPIREDANVVVHLASYASADDWKPAAINSPAVARVEHLRLTPTRRSFLRHPPLL
jgi:NIPSNAP